MSLSESDLTLLKSLIKTTTKSNLEEILLSLVITSPSFASTLATKLLTTRAHNEELQSSSNSSENDSDLEEPHPKKRRVDPEYTTKLVPAFGTCLICKEQFELFFNADDQCATHAGSLEPTEAMFTDNDFPPTPRSHDPEEGVVRNFPEFFEWSCCGVTARDVGEECVVGKHATDQKGLEREMRRRERVKEKEREREWKAKREAAGDEEETGKGNGKGKGKGRKKGKKR